jgi:sterol desaturase/sphingolipid hydroxylase (fatty acid hydroxylase superfamily)
MAQWVHALDVGAYQFIAAVWAMYWPTFLIVAAFTALERLFPLESNLPWRAVRFNLVWQVFALSMFVVLLWTAWGEFIHWAAAKAGTPLVYIARSDSLMFEAGRILLLIAVNDFLQYWVHRLMHAVPALWVVHRFHHDETHLHAATSLRQHWLSFPLTQMMLLPAAWLWGSDPAPAYAGLTIVAIAAFHHSNIRIDTGMPPIIVGPQMHRIHHAPERAVHDKNFAAVFPLWDMLFGTYVAPRKGKFDKTGLTGQPATDSYGKAFVQPLLDWRQMLRKY